MNSLLSSSYIVPYRSGNNLLSFYFNSLNTPFYMGIYFLLIPVLQNTE